MKKYILNSLALIIALSLISFAQPLKKKRLVGTTILKFTGSITSWSDVSNLSKWVEDPNFDPSESCQGCMGACAMEVPDIYLTGSYPNRTLDPSVVSLSYSGGCYGGSYGYLPVTMVNGSSYHFSQWYGE